MDKYFRGQSLSIYKSCSRFTQQVNYGGRSFVSNRIIKNNYIDLNDLSYLTIA